MFVALLGPTKEEISAMQKRMEENMDFKKRTGLRLVLLVTLAFLATGALFGADDKPIRIGFIPLTDSASVVMAQELGLFKKYGVNVVVSKEASWANVRDKLLVGEL